MYCIQGCGTTRKGTINHAVKNSDLTTQGGVQTVAGGMYGVALAEDNKNFISGVEKVSACISLGWVPQN